MSKKKSVSRSRPKSSKAKKAPKISAPANDTGTPVEVIQMSEFDGVLRRGRRSGYVKFAQALLASDKESGVTIPIPEGRDADKYRSYSYEGMRKALASLGEPNLKVSVLMKKDRKGLVVCRRS